MKLIFTKHEPEKKPWNEFADMFLYGAAGAIVVFLVITFLMGGL